MQPYTLFLFSYFVLLLNVKFVKSVHDVAQISSQIQSPVVKLYIKETNIFMLYEYVNFDTVFIVR